MSFPGITNFRIEIPGTDYVTAYLAIYADDPERWTYSLWGADGTEDEVCIASNDIRIPQPGTYTVTPEQVAKIAFLLEVEYADA